MKILVIFTGGTIGSTVTNGWIATDNATKYALIEKYKEKFGDDVLFETLEPYFLLSENLCAEKINLLLQTVESGLNSDADGIIITHGTDSLHFSASAIHLAFNYYNKPIVFVSANYPLENTLSNGHANFEGAVSLIKSGIKSGVYISYKNPLGSHFIHSANKALSFCESDDSIYSVNKKPFGIYDGKNIEILEQPETDLVSFKTTFCENSKILAITTAPGDSFDYSPEKYKAIILRPYHSGTLNTENQYFKEFLLKAKLQNIPVFLANAPFGTTYETVKEFENLGIIPLPLTTFPYVYMKLWAAISENKNLKNLF